MPNVQELVGKKFLGRTRTISDGEFNILQDLTWQTARIHTDSDYMKKTHYGDRIMSGSILVCIAMGLEGTSDLRPAFKAYNIVDAGQLGVEGIQFTSPVHPGDSVWSETEILEIRASRKNPNRFVVKLRMKLFKKPDTLVLDAVRVSLRQIEI